MENSDRVLNRLADTEPRLAFALETAALGRPGEMRLALTVLLDWIQDAIRGRAALPGWDDTLAHWHFWCDVADVDPVWTLAVAREMVAARDSALVSACFRILRGRRNRG